MPVAMTQIERAVICTYPASSGESASVCVEGDVQDHRRYDSADDSLQDSFQQERGTDERARCPDKFHRADQPPFRIDGQPDGV